MPEEVSNQDQDTPSREQSEAEIDAELEKAKETPLPETPAQEEPPQVEPPQEGAKPYWQGWNVPGLDSEEKAQKWVQDTRNWNLQLAQEVTRLKQAQARPQAGPPQKANFNQLLAKHKTAGLNDEEAVNAALQDLFEEREKGLLSKVNEQQSVQAKQQEATQTLLNYAKEGLIPELIPPQRGPNGEVIAEGSEFGKEVEGILLWGQDEFGESFSQNPHRAFHSVIYAMGLRAIEEGRKKNSGKDVLNKEAGKLAKVSGGGRNVPSTGRKDWSTASEEELDQKFEEMARASEG